MHAHTHLGVQDLGQGVPVLCGSLNVQRAHYWALRCMAGACNQGFDQRVLTDTQQLSCGSNNTRADVISI